MTETQDLCPISDTGNHRYFIFKVVEVFEPVKVYVAEDDNPNMMSYRNLYEKVEYAISGCNCGSAVRQRVKQQ